MEIVLSTRNPSKAKQIQAMFEGSLIRVLTLDQAGIPGEAVEDGATLLENSRKKAEFAQKQSATPIWTMADDTGIFITALNGEPGVRSARWAGEDVTTADITAYCLQRLHGATDRSARFETVVVVLSPLGEEFHFVGSVEGHLLAAPRVPPQPKMPYSPLFVPDSMDKCWAQMTVEEENEISHRGKAFAQVRAFLLTLV